MFTFLVVLQCNSMRGNPYVNMQYWFFYINNLFYEQFPVNGCFLDKII